MTVDRPKPAFRAREKIERGHEHQGEAVVQASHPATDQSHVVVEGQPAHEHVVRRCAERRGHGPERCEHVAMAEHHALGVAGAPGGVLEERDGGLVESRTLAVAAVPVESGDVDHRGQSRHLRGQQSRHAERRTEGHQHPDRRIRENSRVSTDMILELARTRGRIDRHRNRADHLHREERRQVIEAGRQHQRRAPARFESALHESGRDVLRAFHQRRERDPRRLPRRFVELDVHAVRMVSRVKIHRFEQRLGTRGNRVHRLEPRFAAAHRHRRPSAPAARQQRGEQLPSRLRVRHHRPGYRGAEPALDSREQLHAREAVETEIPVKRTVQGNVKARTEVGVQFDDHVTDRLEQRLGVGGLRLDRLFLRAFGHDASVPGGRRRARATPAPPRPRWTRR